jgi:hypothetical protein
MSLRSGDPAAGWSNGEVEREVYAAVGRGLTRWWTLIHNLCMRLWMTSR